MAEIRAANGKFIGHLHDRVLTKKMAFSRHLLLRPVPAIAIDLFAWEQNRQYIDVIEAVDEESGKTYTMTRERFDICARIVERGHLKQYAAPLSRWKIKGEQETGQLAMFE